MRLLLAILFAALGLPSFGQLVTTVNTVADLQNRIPKTGETVSVLGYYVAKDWGEARDFKHATNDVTPADGGMVFTNKAVGTRYKALDALAPLVDVRWFGAKGDGIADDAARINAATTYAEVYSAASSHQQGASTVLLPATAGGYRITDTVHFTTPVDASAASLVWDGDVDGLAVLVGPDDGEGFAVSGGTYLLPNILGFPSGGQLSDSTGIRIQNLLRCTVRFGYVRFFGIGLEIRGTYQGTGLNELSGGMFENIRIGHRFTTDGAGGWANANSFFGLCFNNSNGSLAPGTETGREILTMDGPHNGNVWIGGSWEGFASRRVVAITNCSANQFSGIRLEAHPGIFTASEYTSHYMEVHADSAGLGIDNRWTGVSQMSGMYGMNVRETGVAAGNSGADSRGIILRSRDQGFNRGGIVLESSNANSDCCGSSLSVYPSMVWPKHPATNYTEWSYSLNPRVSRWKLSGDVGSRLEIAAAGGITLHDGTALYPATSLWSLENGGRMNWFSGASRLLSIDAAGLFATNQMLFGTSISNAPALTLDSSGTPGDTRASLWDVTAGAARRIRYDPESKLFHGDPSTTSAGWLQTNRHTSYGGLQLIGAPTNQLNGFLLYQRMEGAKALAGISIVGEGPTPGDYASVNFGTFSPDNESGFVAGKIGLHADWSSGSAVSNFVVAVGPPGGLFSVTVGPGGNPSIQANQSTNTPDTRLGVWVVQSNAVVQVKYDNASRLFYGGGSPPVVGGGGVTDHGALTGLADDDHPQYLQKAGGTVTGVITSTLAVGTAPFVVTSSNKVVNLNVDRLNDKLGGEYLDTSTGAQNKMGILTLGSGLLVVTNTQPTVMMIDVDGAADTKKWRTIANAGVLYHQGQNDAETTNSTWMTVQRSGQDIASVDIAGSQVRLGNSSQLVVTNGAAVLNGKFYFGTLAGPFVSAGSGTPESAVAAPIGSLFMRTDGGASTTLYVKQSGTGNTGWVAK